MSLDAQIGGSGGPSLSDVPEDVFRVLSHPFRSTTVSILRRQGDVATTDLATRLVARLESEPLAEVTESERDPVLVTLRHHHLPKLDERDVVEWDRTGGTVSLVDDLPVRDDRLEVLLAAASDGNESARVALSNERRVAVLEVLADGDGTASMDDLAEAVAARETDRDPDDVPEAERKRVRVSLYHADVPAMEAADVLEYDRDADAVSLSELPSVSTR